MAVLHILYNNKPACPLTQLFEDYTKIVEQQYSCYEIKYKKETKQYMQTIRGTRAAVYRYSICIIVYILKCNGMNY